MVLGTNCTQQKSKIDVKVCNQSLNKITEITLIYSKNIENIPSLSSSKCAQIKLKNIISESGLSIKYLQGKQYLEHNINIYFEKFSYEGVIQILINNKNINVTHNIEIK